MKENVYIPFNMIIDTDYGIIRFIEKTQTDKLPMKDSDLKHLLLNRMDENPINNFNAITKNDILPSAYDLILDKYYSENLFKISTVTDMINFIVTTHNMNVGNDIQITVGCDYEDEIKYLDKISSTFLNMKVNSGLNSQIDLKKFHTIFTKYIDEDYVDWLLDVAKVESSRLYVANYAFNTILEPESHATIIDPILHMRLESKGVTLSLVDIYNHLKE